LRDSLEQWLGAELPDPVWLRLLDEGFVAEAAELGADYRPTLVQVARTYLRDARRSTDRPQGRSLRSARPIDFYLDSSVEMRSRVASDYWAMMAATEPRVRRFRREVLAGYRTVGQMPPTKGSLQPTIRAPDGRVAESAAIEDASTRVLSDRQFRSFLDSHALRFVESERLRELGVPVAGHRTVDFHIERRMGAEDGSGEDGWWSMRAVVTLETDGNLVVTERSIALNVLLGDHPGLPDRRPPLSLMAGSDPERSLPPMSVEEPVPSNVWVSVWHGSVHDDLWQLADWISCRYPWTKAQSIRFLLTGRSPSLHPVVAGFECVAHREATFAQIHLLVEPWVPEPAVRAGYRRLQQRMLGRDNRQANEQTLALFSWVADRRLSRQRATWPELVADWDREHPGHMGRGGDFRRLRTYWTRAMSTVFPNYRHPSSED